MFSFRKSLAALVGLFLLVVASAALLPLSGRGQGQGGGLKLPLYEEVSHDKAAFHVHNLAKETRTAIGVYGTGRQGVTGQTSHDVDGVGVYGLGGRGEFSSGVHGKADNGYGVYGLSANNIGVVGIRGESFNNYQTRGILGTKDNAIEGVSRVSGGKGVAGVANSGANAVGVYGESTGGIAGFFRGRVTATESILTKQIFAEKITGASKLFRIDHPRHPAEKYLSHTSVESDEMANVYSGNVTLDARGEAWVRLPDWFEALNADFRYQLTCVGGFAPVHVAREITNHRFLIAGGRAGMKVSWQVTGVRHDAYAKAHPLQVEQEKPAAERGRYLHPGAFGLPTSRGIGDEGRQRAGGVDAGRGEGQEDR